MKKVLLAALVAGLSVGSVYAAPTVYGELDVSVDRVDVDKSLSPATQDNWKVNSNNSLIGVKGDEKLTDGLSVIYLAEWGISGDGDSADWTQRNRYVGLKSDKLGSLKVGKFDSYVKRLGGVDLFDNYVANTVDIHGTLTGENRLDNTVSYETPALKVLGGDVQWNALVAAGEDNSDDAAISATGSTSGKGLADAFSTSVTYKHPVGLSGGIGYDSGVGSRWLGVSGSPIVTTNILRASGSFDIKEIGLSLRALVQRAEVDNAKTTNAATLSGATPVTIAASIATLNNVDDETAFLLGGSFKVPGIEQLSLKAQYNHATTSYKKTTKDVDIEQIALGVDYAFNSKARAYAYLAQNSKDNGTTDLKTRYAGLGLEYKF